jgi:alkaline phosphatase D
MVEDPEAPNTMIGREQRPGSSRPWTPPARWNVIGNQIGMFSYTSYGPDANIMGRDDHGYARDRIMYYLANSPNSPSNPVVITGDPHCSWVADLKADYRDEDSETVGTEFIGTSITADSIGQLVR